MKTAVVKVRKQAYSFSSELMKLTLGLQIQADPWILLLVSCCQILVNFSLRMLSIYTCTVQEGVRQWSEVSHYFGHVGRSLGKCSVLEIC